MGPHGQVPVATVSQTSPQTTVESFSGNLLVLLPAGRPVSPHMVRLGKNLPL
jgi:hypothetical protein